MSKHTNNPPFWYLKVYDIERNDDLNASMADLIATQTLLVVEPDCPSCYLRATFLPLSKCHCVS